MDVARDVYADRRQRLGIGGELQHRGRTGVAGEFGVVRLVASVCRGAGVGAGERVEVRGDQEVGPALEGTVEKDTLVDDGDAGGDGVAGLIPRRGQRGQGVVRPFDHPDAIRAEDVDEPLQPAPFVGVTVAYQQVVRFGRGDLRAGAVEAHAGRAGMGQR